MIVLVLIILGLSLGSFINAWVWRTYQQTRKQSAKTKNDYSILHGRSMCVNCKHTLGALDLIPVFSWLALKGRCRYCHKPISWQYPLVEVLTAGLFVFSYAFWPTAWTGESRLVFGFWLIQLVCLVALAVYDLRWYILPNRMIIVLAAAFGVRLASQAIFFDIEANYLFDLLLAAVVGGGLFWVLFQVSKGKWIGGGDVKLGAVLGLLVGGPIEAFLVIFLASIIGTVTAAPLLISKRLRANSQLPFGPFLILATIIVFLFGPGLIEAYKRVVGL